MSLRESPRGPQPSGGDDSPPPAPAVVDAINALARRGRLTPEDVLAAARDKSSPLHDSFEWDDDAAAHAYRLDQARGLIRRVRVFVTVADKVLCVPRYTRDPAAGQDQGYVSHEQLRSEPQTAQAMVAYEISRAYAHLQRAYDLARSQSIKLMFAPEIERLLRKMLPPEAKAG